MPDEPAATSNADRWNGDPPQSKVLELTVASRFTVTSERYDKSAPVVRGKDEDGNVWEVAGWRSHLRQVIEDADPQPGDSAAFRAFGEGPTGQFLYGLNVARNSDEPGVPF